MPLEADGHEGQLHRESDTVGCGLCCNFPEILKEPLGRGIVECWLRALIVHGEFDELVPLSHTHRLYGLAAEPKCCWSFLGQINDSRSRLSVLSRTVIQRLFADRDGGDSDLGDVRHRHLEELIKDGEE
jgi:hypothetical protein